MSRETTTRVRCARCFYGCVSVPTELDEVDEALARRGWGKDDKGQDLCDTCLQMDEASDKRLDQIREWQAAHLLKWHGLDEKPEWVLCLVKAQNLVLGALQSGREDYEDYMSERLTEARDAAFEIVHGRRE